MLLKLQIDEKTLAELNQAAARELRPVPMQAIVEIRRSLGIQSDGRSPSNVTPLARRPVGAAGE